MSQILLHSTWRFQNVTNENGFKAFPKSTLSNIFLSQQHLSSPLLLIIIAQLQSTFNKIWTSWFITVIHQRLFWTLPDNIEIRSNNWKILLSIFCAEKPRCLPGLNFLRLLGGTDYLSFWFLLEHITHVSIAKLLWCSHNTLFTHDRKWRSIRRTILCSFWNDGCSVACYACFLYGVQCIPFSLSISHTHTSITIIIMYPKFLSMMNLTNIQYKSWNICWTWS